jgi:hypothetical protein
LEPGLQVFWNPNRRWPRVRNHNSSFRRATAATTSMKAATTPTNGRNLHRRAYDPAFAALMEGTEDLIPRDSNEEYEDRKEAPEKRDDDDNEEEDPVVPLVKEPALEEPMVEAPEVGKSRCFLRRARCQRLSLCWWKAPTTRSRWCRRRMSWWRRRQWWGSTSGGGQDGWGAGGGQDCCFGRHHRQ